MRQYRAVGTEVYEKCMSWPRWSPDLFLSLPQCLDGPDPGTLLLPVSDHHLPTSSPVTIFIWSHLSHPHPTPANTVFFLFFCLFVFSLTTPYCQAPMSSEIQQNNPTEVKAAAICICGPPAPTSAWTSICPQMMWLWRTGPLLPQAGRGEAQEHPASLSFFFFFIVVQL